ncbi:MAG: DUF5683 domain-containing protein [Bacteroidota bacterium]
MRVNRFLILFFLCSFLFSQANAQDDKKKLATSSVFNLKKDSSLAKDSAVKITAVKKDTIPKHIPRIATRRSALIPGWGQAYNREYWKIPLVYGVLAIPTVLFFYNDSYYKKTKFAYEAVYAASLPIGQGRDSSNLKNIDAAVKHADGSPLSLSDYQNYRNIFRQNRDYSVLWFLLAWGLQVADATVFAHLKQFDVSSDLSMDITPTFNPTTRTPGLGLTLSLKNTSQKRAIAR